MGITANLPIVLALLLAVMAALVSGDAEARQEIVSFVTTALKPQVVDLGGDPDYLSEMDAQVFPLPPPITVPNHQN
jgi:hypothetical protein